MYVYLPNGGILVSHDGWCDANMWYKKCPSNWLWYDCVALHLKSGCCEVSYVDHRPIITRMSAMADAKCQTANC